MDKLQDNRIAHLEEAIAHMTRLTDELSDVIARQDGQIAMLTRRVEMLMAAEALRQADDGADSVPLADQRPPHW